MDVMGDKATLLETGRFAQHADIALPADFVLPAESASSVESAGVADEDETGDAVEEARQRLAAEAGDTEAMSVLGAMLLRRGDLDGAEPCLRAATAAGDRAAANNLGVLLHQRGYADEAAGWWRVAAVAVPPPPRTRSAGTIASAVTNRPPSTGCASPPSRGTPWARTRSPTCWSTAVTPPPSGG